MAGRIVSSSADKTAKIWDVETGEKVLAFDKHEEPLIAVAFSRDGRWVASGGYDNDAKLWDAETGREIATLKGHQNPVRDIAFSPVGRWLVTGSEDNTVKIWDVDTRNNTRTLQGHEWCVSALAFSPDGNRIVSGSWDRTIRVWDAKTGDETLALRGHTAAVGSVAFSPDGRWIASGSEDNTVRLWDAGVGVEVVTLRGHHKIEAIAISPGGRKIATSDETGCRTIWDAVTGERLADDPQAEAWRGRQASTDGLTRVIPMGNTVRLIRTTTPTATSGPRTPHGAPAWEPDWCDRDAKECEEAQNWFAANFHLHRLAQLKPEDTTVQSRLKVVETMLAEVISPMQPTPWLPRSFSSQSGNPTYPLPRDGRAGPKRIPKPRKR